jgi:hypothetical protein
MSNCGHGISVLERCGRCENGVPPSDQVIVTKATITTEQLAHAWDAAAAATDHQMSLRAFVLFCRELGFRGIA